MAPRTMQVGKEEESCLESVFYFGFLVWGPHPVVLGAWRLLVLIGGPLQCQGLLLGHLQTKLLRVEFCLGPGNALSQ